LERINGNIVRANELLNQANEWCVHIGNKNVFIVTLAPPEPKEKDDKGTGSGKRSDKNGDRDSVVQKVSRKNSLVMNKPREEKINKITFDKGSALFILNTFIGKFRPICVYCGTHVTQDNLGAVVKEGFMCDNVCCIIKSFKELK